MTQISSFSAGKFWKDHAVSGYFDCLQAHETAGAQNAPSLKVEFTSDTQSKTHQALREAETSRRGKVSPSKTTPIRPSRGQTLHHVVKSLQEPQRGKEHSNRTSGGESPRNHMQNKMGGGDKRLDIAGEKPENPDTENYIYTYIKESQGERRILK